MKKNYLKIKNLIKENLISLIIIFAIILINIVELPFYIDKTGGLIDLSSRIDIDKNFKLEGSLNMTYVSSTKGRIPNLLIALLNPNWDIIKIEEHLGTETEEQMYFRNRLALDESIDNAILLAYNKADVKVEIIEQKLYVTYIYEEANTDLKVGDQIISVDDIIVSNKIHLNNYINSLNANDSINIKVLNNDKEYIRKAKILDIEGIKLIGIMVNTDYNIKLTPELKLSFNKSESGSSGGLMMSLAIYCELTSQDITKGKKISGTGSIDLYGKVGEIDGIKYKLAGAVKNKADIFIVPNGNNYEEAIKEKEKNKYDIEIIGVNTFDDALRQLKKTD